MAYGLIWAPAARLDLKDRKRGQAGFFSLFLLLIQSFRQKSSLSPFLKDHKDVSTTMIYPHVLNRGGKAVRSPADGLTTPNAWQG